MPSYPTPRAPCRDTHDGASDAPEPMIGYEAALPYLLSGHDGACWSIGERRHDAPLSYSETRSSPMGEVDLGF